MHCSPFADTHTHRLTTVGTLSRFQDFFPLTYHHESAQLTKVGRMAGMMAGRMSGTRQYVRIDHKHVSRQTERYASRQTERHASRPIERGR